MADNKKITRATKSGAANDIDAFLRGAENALVGLDNEARSFKNEAQIIKPVRPTDTIMRTYYVKVNYWMTLKRLSAQLTLNDFKNVGNNELINEALELLFAKHGIKITEHSSIPE